MTKNSLKYYRDLKNSLDTAFDEGRAEGREQGREEGKEEGREQRALEIAKEMLAEGESAERVARFTGLAPAVVYPTPCSLMSSYLLRPVNGSSP
jgi:predicted transposase/invertase (TIGR01784 family)